MKILVISDTHGKIDEAIEIVENQKPQLIIHLGDYVEDGENIERKTGIKVEMVRGNGDFFNKNYEDDRVLEIGGKRIFLTHGHKYRVKYGMMNLLYRAEELNADIALFGHTHVPMIIEEKGILVMNPGSISFPRGYQNFKTYGIMDIQQEITRSIEKI